MHDGMQCDPIQGQRRGHTPLKVGMSPKQPILCVMGRKTVTQSIKHVVLLVKTVGVQCLSPSDWKQPQDGSFHSWINVWVAGKTV